jgi:hypothetical protein
MFSQMKKTLKSEEGILDLASIITGVIITGILGAIIAASFIFIIPWFHDKAASDDIQLIKIAEDSHYSDQSKYGDEDALKAGRYLHKTLSTAACVAVTATGDNYTVYVTSKSKKIFSYSPTTATAANNTKPVEVASIPVTTPVCK